MRGAAFLSDVQNGVVVVRVARCRSLERALNSLAAAQDVGGTTTDVGVLVAVLAADAPSECARVCLSRPRAAVPRPSAVTASIGGVRTKFRVPDVLSVGLGGSLRCLSTRGPAAPHTARQAAALWSPRTGPVLRPRSCPLADFRWQRRRRSRWPRLGGVCPHNARQVLRRGHHHRHRHPDCAARCTRSVRPLRRLLTSRGTGARGAAGVGNLLRGGQPSAGSQPERGRRRRGRRRAQGSGGRGAVPLPHLSRARARPQIMQGRVEDAIDMMKTTAEGVPVILVGGGSVLGAQGHAACPLLGDQRAARAVGSAIAGASQVIHPAYYAVANAVGAAIAQVSAEHTAIIGGAAGREHELKAVSRSRQRQCARSSAARQAKERVKQLAVEKGAEEKSVEIVEVTETQIVTPATTVRAVRRLVLPRSD